MTPDDSLNTLVSQVTRLVDRWNTREDQMIDWLGGTAHGGPADDGRYPLTDGLGATHPILCPAALADLVAGPAGAATDAATQAAASASAAAASATDAASSLSATQAIQADLADLKTTVTGLKDDTAASATAADQAQQAAVAARDAAATSETNAGDSASAAAQSQTQAQGSATAAAASAGQATDSATASATSANQAASDASDAAGSATAAAGSATDAAGSATAASGSASDAASSASDAQGSATASATSASQAASDASDAQGFATAAATSQTNAATSADAAASSATDAAASAVNAETEADRAQTLANSVRPKNNDTATTDPGATDDSDAGYSVRSLWINTATGEIFRCIDATATAAVWVATSLTLDELGSAATANTSDFATAAQGELADTAIQPDVLDGVRQLPHNAFVPDDLLDNYPVGTSEFYSVNQGWPGGYSLITTHNNGAGAGYQDCVQMNTQSTHQTYPRWYRSKRDSNSFWGDWEKLLRVGDYGLGEVTTYGGDLNDFTRPGFTYANQSGHRPKSGNGYTLNFPYTDPSQYSAQMYIPSTPGDRLNIHLRRLIGGSWRNWLYFLNSGNTTVDSNGFIKQASPVVRLYADRVTLNDDFKATFEKIETGVYVVHNDRGFAAEGWFIESPRDVNGVPKCYLEYEQDDAGNITVRTYAPVFNQGFAQPGAPQDIPADRWVDLRLNEADQANQGRPPSAQPLTPGQRIEHHRRMTVVSKLQLVRAINAAGQRDTFDTALAQADRDIRDGWELATQIYRMDPLVARFGAALGYDDTALDGLFSQARTL